MDIMGELVGPRQASERVRDMTRQLQALIEGAGTGSSGRLPSERQLAQRFRCSRNTVREALAALTAQGVIGIRERVGAYRLPPPVAAAADLEQALGALHVTIPALSGLAAKKASVVGVSRLETVTSNLSQALLNRDAAAAYRCYVTFFVELAELAGNAYLARMLREIRDAARLLPAGRLSRREEMEAFFSDLVALLQALRRGDGQEAAPIATRCVEGFAASMRAAKAPGKQPLTENRS